MFCQKKGYRLPVPQNFSKRRYAQRGLGAAKTSAYYALAPFLGAGLSLLLFRQWPQPTFWAALLLMAGGTWRASTEGA